MGERRFGKWEIRTTITIPATAEAKRHYVRWPGYQAHATEAEAVAEARGAAAWRELLAASQSASALLFGTRHVKGPVNKLLKKAIAAATGEAET